MLFPLFSLERHGEQAVRRQLRRALPTNPVLLSSPATNGRYLPPLLLARAKLSARAHRDARLYAVVVVLMTLVGAILFYLGSDLRGAVFFSTVYLTICGFAGFNLWLVRARPDAVEARWMFYGWCFAHGRQYALGFLALMVPIGAAQLVGSELLGSAEAYKRALGLIFAELPASGEWWRLVTAALVHNGVAHWLANMVIGTGLLTVYGPVLGARGILAGLIAAPASFLIVLLAVWAYPTDAFGIIGISGACAGFMGCFFAANLRRPGSFPGHYVVVTAFVATVTLFVVPFFLSIESFIAHFAGFSVGAVIGMLIDPFAPGFHRAEPAAD